VGTDDLVWVAGASAYIHPTTAGNKHVPAAGASGEVLKYDSAGTAVWASSIPTYTEVSRQAASAKNMVIRLYANPSGLNVALVGGSMGGNVSTVSENASSYSYGATAGGVYVELLTGTSADDDCYIGSSSGYAEFQGVSNYYSIHRFSLPVITSVRFFIGLTPYGNSAVINNADNPYSNMIGLRFIAGTDTNFQFVRSAASSVTSTDTSVAPATDVIYQLEQEFSSDGTSLRGRLTNVETGSVLWADTTVTDNLPAATQTMTPIIAAKTETTADAKFRFYKHEVWI